MASSVSAYPKPATWNELARLSSALLSAMRGVEFRPWGALEHRENGADAWAMQADGRALVLQCKGRSRSFGKSLSLANLDAAVREIDTFPHPVEELFVFTTTPDSINLHNHAAFLSEQRAALGLSRVSVLGWNSICAQIDLHQPVRSAFFRPWLLRRPWWQWLSLLMAALAALAMVRSA